MKQNKISQQEIFYENLNRFFNDLGKIAVFILVFWIVMVILNFTIYYDNNPLSPHYWNNAPFWLVLLITVGIYLIRYLIIRK